MNRDGTCVAKDIVVHTRKAAYAVADNSKQTEPNKEVFNRFQTRLLTGRVTEDTPALNSIRGIYRFGRGKG